IGSQVWFSARFNLGRQLQESGQTAAAEQVFQDILIGFEGKFNYQRCMALHMLGRCREVQGQVAAAEQLFRQTLAGLARLEQGQKVRREIGSAQTDLADVLREQGRYREASETYQVSLEIYQELDDARGRAVVTGQLGTLAYLQDELAEAMERWQEALALWQNLNEPISEAVAWHQLGLVYQQAKHWEAAEQAYRQASRLKEKLGLLGGSNGAGASWQQLAQVCFYTNRVEEAEQWYRKALAARRAADDRSGIALTLNNLASLIAKDTVRLDEARHLIEEALAIGLTLDPAAAEVWTTYSILADIASQRGDKSQAAVYRAKSREGYLAFPAWRQQLRQHEELIAAVAQGNGMEAALSRYGEAWANLKAAIQRILSGQRDEASLFEPLNYKEAAVIRAILTNLANELMDVHHSNSSTER
ncbi:MAG: tetratricopeptide repeat protein, partial [Candidatus Electrothrix sp. AX5]|nr:tetratricopeptide repeat protein [Candidatus Electrothrix sp. AX5]